MSTWGGSDSLLRRDAWPDSLNPKKEIAATSETSLELELEEAQTLARSDLLALDQLARGLIHEINNAISPVILYVDSLLESEAALSARGREHLQIIQRAVDDLAQAVARLRGLYRPPEPQSMRRVSLNLLAQQAMELTHAHRSHLAQQRGIVIEVRADLASDLPEIMGADDDLRQALINLIFNALEAMPLGGALTLRTRLVCAEPLEKGAPAQGGVVAKDGFVRIEVIDAGVGMDDETRRRCLEPFFSTKGARGAGLGLAMVFGAVRRHGGYLEIESAVGKGTSMRLSFAPARIAASDVIS